MLAELATRTPLLAGADQIAHIDVDDTVKATYGYAKQGTGFGYSGVKGLNALIATVSTPRSAPVVCATRSARAAPAVPAAQLVWSLTRSSRRRPPVLVALTGKA